MPLVEQKPPTLPEHTTSPPVFSGVCFAVFCFLCSILLCNCLSFVLFRLIIVLVFRLLITHLGLGVWCLIQQGTRVAQRVRQLDYLTTHTSQYDVGSPDEVYQLLLARGRWYSPRTPASSTPKTGRHDIAEILLKHTTTFQLYRCGQFH